MIYKVALIIFIVFNSCGITDESIMFNRFIVTIETNLDSLHIDNTHFDSTSVFPHTLLDLNTISQLSMRTTIYPVADTGVIHFNMFRGQGYDNVPNTSLIDSITIKTPIDTTIVIFQSGGGIDSIIINPSI